MAAGRYNFKPRSILLQCLEDNYGDFILSCRHRDILRCSVTKHFTSCYNPNGIYRHQPYALCCIPNVAIIGKKDRSGAFIWRAFVQLIEYGNKTELIVFKIYGNPPEDVKYKIFIALSKAKETVTFSDRDV